MSEAAQTDLMKGFIHIVLSVLVHLTGAKHNAQNTTLKTCYVRIRSLNIFKLHFYNLQTVKLGNILRVFNVSLYAKMYFIHVIAKLHFQHYYRVCLTRPEK